MMSIFNKYSELDPALLERQIDAALGALGGIQIATMTITSAQILNAHIMPVKVMSAPGAGNAIAPVFVISTMGGSVNYTVNDLFALIYGSVVSGAVSPLGTSVSAVLLESSALSMSMQSGLNFEMPFSKVENAPIYFTTGNFAATNGNGDLKLTIAYLIVSVV
jgi:hypothetical protein